MWPRSSLHLPPAGPGFDVPWLPGHLPGGSGGQHHRAGGCPHQPPHADHHKYLCGQPLLGRHTDVSWYYIISVNDSLLRYLISFGAPHSTLNLYGPLGVGGDSVQAVPLQPGEETDYLVCGLSCLTLPLSQCISVYMSTFTLTAIAVDRFLLAKREKLLLLQLSNIIWRNNNI